MRGKSSWGSDQGCGYQYASRDYRSRLASAGITSSLNRKGICCDNATMASFFATLEAEVFVGHPVQTSHHAERLVFEYVETFYNLRRIHTRLSPRRPLDRPRPAVGDDYQCFATRETSAGERCLYEDIRL